MDLTNFDPDAPFDGSRLFGLPHSVDEAAVAVVPVPWDATTSYRQGTAAAPDNVLTASAQLDLYDLQTQEAWRSGIAMAAVDPQVQAWSAQASDAVQRARAATDERTASAARDEANDAGERLSRWLHEHTASRLANGQIAAVLGGDHSVPLGAMLAAAERHRGLGVLHVDAHLDLRAAYEGFTHSHASILHNVLERAPSLDAVVHVGVRDLCAAEWTRVQQDDRLHAFDDTRLSEALCAGTPWRELVGQMLAPLPSKIWITFDIDGLEPSLCPGTGTPVPGGLSWAHATTLLAAVVRSGRTIVGFDLCEVGPGQWDAIVGARILYKLATSAIVSNKADRAAP